MSMRASGRVRRPGASEDLVGESRGAYVPMVLLDETQAPRDGRISERRRLAWNPPCAPPLAQAGDDPNPPARLPASFVVDSARAVS